MDTQNISDIEESIKWHKQQLALFNQWADEEKESIKRREAELAEYLAEEQE